MKQTIYACIGINDDEGIIAHGFKPDELIPLVTMDLKHVEMFKKIASVAAKQTGKQIVIGKFELSEVVERFTGNELYDR